MKKKVFALLLSGMMAAALMMPVMAAGEKEAAPAETEAMETMEETMEETMAAEPSEGDMMDDMAEEAEPYQVGGFAFMMPEDWEFDGDDTYVEIAPADDDNNMIIVTGGPLDEGYESLEMSAEDDAADILDTAMEYIAMGLNLGDKTAEIRDFTLNGAAGLIAYYATAEEIDESLTLTADAKVGMFIHEDQMVIVVLMKEGADTEMDMTDPEAVPVDADREFMKLLFSLKPVVEE